MESLLNDLLHQTVTICVYDDKRFITNAVFLLGAYLIIQKKYEPIQVQNQMEILAPVLLTYRDISPGDQTFHLELIDCWDAVARARQMGWLDFEDGSFDVDEYDHYDDPCNADLHVVVPDKFIAMKGPKAMPRGMEWRDNAHNCREFSPEYLSDILDDFDVQLVVRLNSPEYPAEAFVNRGIAVVDLYFEDCSTPPDEVILKFLLLAESHPGPLAVHCKAGLGRTGTLIALYMMKNLGFTAREAIAWLRIARPGSVIGHQQQFLCDMEPVMARISSKYPVPVSPPASPAAAGASRSTAELQRAVGDIIERVDSCASGRRRRTASAGDSELRLAEHVSTAADRRSAARAASVASWSSKIL
jgi:cell division cycle 14